MAVETSVSTATFPISFRKASAFGLVLSSLGSVSSFYTYSEERDPKWLAVGLLFGNNLNFLQKIFRFFIFIFEFFLVGSLTYNYLALTPIYKKLSDPNLDKDSSDSESMIRLFGNLHSIKALIGFMSMVLVNMNLLKINTK